MSSSRLRRRERRWLPTRTVTILVSSFRVSFLSRLHSLRFGIQVDDRSVKALPTAQFANNACELTIDTTKVAGGKWSNRQRGG